MDDIVGAFTDDDGQTWQVCVFVEPAVQATRPEEPDAAPRQATFVFERPSEERIIVTPLVKGWNSDENLHVLFAMAVERRSGDDRRSGDERRVATARAELGRRSGLERRQGERRSGRQLQLIR